MVSNKNFTSIIQRSVVLDVTDRLLTIYTEWPKSRYTVTYTYDCALSFVSSLNHVDRNCGATAARTTRLRGIVLSTGWGPTALFFGGPSIPGSGIPASLDRESGEH